jgi:hypothetical protein
MSSRWKLHLLERTLALTRTGALQVLNLPVEHNECIFVLFSGVSVVVAAAQSFFFHCESKRFGLALAVSLNKFCTVHLITTHAL